MSFLKFIFSKVFFLNLFIALVITAGLLFAVIFYLDNFTHHGEQIVVPNVIGKKVKDLDSALVDKGFEYVIIDSIFDRKKPKGVVVDQSPSPEYFVKEGRKMYLTINARTTKKITIKEEMTDLSVKDAVSRLQSYGVQVDIQTKISSPAGVVLKVSYHGVKVVPGQTLINDGDKITLLISESSNSSSYYSEYIGLTLNDAINQTMASSFTPLAIQVGKPLCKSESDSMSSVVIRQRPEYVQGMKLKSGSPVELYFSCDSTYKEP